MNRSAMVAAALVACAFAVHAKTVVIDQTVDAAILRNGENAMVFTGAPFTLSAGDTLTVNFSFLPGQSLQLVDPFVFGMFAGATDRSRFINTVHRTSLTFQGLQGAAYNPAAIEQTTLGFGASALFFGEQFMTNGTGTISFTGAQFSTTVNAFSTGDIAREFSDLGLYALGYRVKAVASVPEPASALLCSLGIAALGWNARGRRGLQAQLRRCGVN